MKSIGHREYLTHLAWLEEEWDRPNRTDWYLMQVAYEVRYTHRKRWGKKLGDLKIPFGKAAQVPAALRFDETDEEFAVRVSEAARDRWHQRIPDHAWRDRN